MKKIINTLFLLGIIVVGLFCYFYYQIQSPLFLKDSTIFVIDKDTPQEVFNQLKNEKAISSELLPTYLAKLKRVTKIKQGHYYFKKETSCSTFINTLRSGRQTPIKLTFNNTRTLSEFAKKISNQLQFSEEDFLKHLTDKNTAMSYNFDEKNFIGMFLPNTYEMYYTTTPEQFTDRMYKEYQRFWTVARKQKAAKLGYTPQQISALAAIVDEETNKNDEKRRIAGVYLNRLQRGVPLQADPTLKFVAKDFSLKRILNKHKEIDSPYNTYKYTGLPPGAIRQPSIAGIDAVLNAEKHNYLYFCAKSDFSGYHAFARTLAEHNENARKYHNELNKRGIR